MSKTLHASCIALALTLGCFPFVAAQPKPAGGTSMPIGTWQISSSPPANLVSVCDQYLPRDTRVQVHADGATRLAIEEQRRDELGGRLVLLSPINPAICRTGLGSSTGFGLNVCNSEGQLRSNLPPDVAFDDLVLNLSRWSLAEAKDPDNEFFSSRGAKAGARFALLTLKDKGLMWRVWLKSSSEMVSECLVTLPGKNNIDSFPMHWRLLSRP